MEIHYLPIAVVGLHLTGESLNYQLTELDAIYVKTCKTAKKYNFYLVKEGEKQKPALIRVNNPEKGNAYEVEIWNLPIKNVGEFLEQIPSPLGLGTLVLEDESLVKGFIGEAHVIEIGEDISSFNGWRDYRSPK